MHVCACPSLVSLLRGIWPFLTVARPPRPSIMESGRCRLIFVSLEHMLLSVYEM